MTAKSIGCNPGLDKSSLWPLAQSQSLTKRHHAGPGGGEQSHGQTPQRAWLHQTSRRSLLCIRHPGGLGAPRMQEASPSPRLGSYPSTSSHSISSCPPGHPGTWARITPLIHRRGDSGSKGPSAPTSQQTSDSNPRHLMPRPVFPPPTPSPWLWVFFFLSDYKVIQIQCK